MNHSDDELVIRGPVMVPVGWLIAILGCAGTGLALAFAVGIWCASLASEVKANSAEVEKYSDNSERLVRVETILAVRFPDEAREADRQIASKRQRK